MYQSYQKLNTYSTCVIDMVQLLNQGNIIKNFHKITRAIGELKKIKGIQQEGEILYSLFGDYIIIYICDPQKLYQKIFMVDKHFQQRNII